MDTQTTLKEQENVLNKKVTSNPNGKINLGLFILNRRPDNYHNIETAILPVNMYDTLEFTESDTDSITVTGHKLDTDNFKDNLVYKALSYCREIKEIPPLSIHLEKKIPIKAGLGGGSSDASFMINMLNETYDLKLSEIQRIEIASKIGSDCPFFIRNRPTLATGQGEILSDVDINYNLSKYYVQLVVPPDIQISTKEAYSKVIPNDTRLPLAKILVLPIESWKNYLINDFEEALFPEYPLLAEIKKGFYQKGAVYASMSGSGSAIFGIFKKDTVNK